MRLCAALLTDTLGDGAMRRNPDPRPKLIQNIAAMPHYTWCRRNNDPRFRARLNSPHPRTLYTPSGANAEISISLPKTPTAPHYRIILGNGDYTPTGNLGLFVAGALGLEINPISIPTNGYATIDFDPTALFGGYRADPAAYILLIPTTEPPAPSELGDIRLLACVDLDPILANLTPTETNYDLALFTPLAERALMGRTLRTRTYTIDLLVERDDPAYPFLTRLRDYDQLYIEQDDRYIPVALADYTQTPAGGMLYAIQLKLAATDAYALDLERYIQTLTFTAGQIVTNMPGSAPAPAEIRIHIADTPPSTPITIYMRPTGETLAFQPDAAGIWSLHDSGRIYHCPTEDPAPLIDRTDTLQVGALPMQIAPGNSDWYIDAPDYTIPTVTLAAYPRYQPDPLL